LQPVPGIPLPSSRTYDADRLRGLIDVSLREQRGDRFFLLACEFGAVAFHLAQPGAICPWSTIAFPIASRIALLVPATALEQSSRLLTVLTQLRDLYRHHIATEDNEVFPAAAAVLSASDRAAIGSEMASRRGIPVSA
jgi:hypothetical protein